MDSATKTPAWPGSVTSRAAPRDPPSSSGSAAEEEERLGALLRACLWARLGLTTVLFVLATMLAVHRSEGGLQGFDVSLLLLLLYAYAFSLLTGFCMRARSARDLLVKLQVAWDLGFTAAWIYCTGGTGSLFIFLYLFVIIEGSILLGLYGSVLVAVVCGLLYWLELHLEFHWALFPRVTPIAAPVVARPAGYPVASLIFILAAMASTAWLTGSLKQRFSRTHLLLQEKSDKVKDLLHLNESIVRCIRSGLITLDRDGRITSVNEAASVITQRGSEDLIGQDVRAFLGRIPLEELDEQDDASPAPFRWEQTYRREDGKSLMLGCSGAVLRDHRGERFGHLIVFQDLTHYKRMEEELRRKEKLAAIGELAAGLAHEIRNPLASLYGSIQLLEAELPLNGTEKQLMRIVLKESERLNGLITDFLLFASPHAGEKESIPLRELVEETLMVFRKGPGQGEAVRIRVHVEPSIRVHGNRRQMEQVLWNLLLNAKEAMPGGGEIRVEAEQGIGPAGARSVLWRIRDTGRGIPAEHLGRIFDPFFTSRQDGTGLGLAIVHRIVESHGGKIRVESRVGKGTLFEIELPCAESARSGTQGPGPGDRSSCASHGDGAPGWTAAREGAADTDRTGQAMS